MSTSSVCVHACVCLDVTWVLYLQLQHYPDHVKGLILMGDINVNYLKDLDAAEKVGTLLRQISKLMLNI